MDAAEARGKELVEEWSVSEEGAVLVTLLASLETCWTLESRLLDLLGMRKVGLC